MKSTVGKNVFRTLVIVFCFVVILSVTNNVLGNENYNCSNNKVLGKINYSILYKTDEFIQNKCSKKDPEKHIIIIEQSEDISIDKNWESITDMWKKIRDKLKDKEKKIGKEGIEDLIGNIDPMENADLEVNDQDKKEGDDLDDIEKGKFVERTGDDYVRKSKGN